MTIHQPVDHARATGTRLTAIGAAVLVVLGAAAALPAHPGAAVQLGHHQHSHPR